MNISIKVYHILKGENNVFIRKRNNLPLIRKKYAKIPLPLIEAIEDRVQDKDTPVYLYGNLIF